MPKVANRESRSEQREKERLGALLERVGAQNMAALAESLPQAMESKVSMWADGVEPLPFDQFCVLLDGSPLYPGPQTNMLDRPNLMRAASIIAPDKLVQEFILVWGKGSGKDYLSAKLISWMAYVFLSLRDPAEHFKRARGAPYDILNCAPDEDLAKNVFFKYLTSFIKNPVFDQWHPRILTERIHFEDVRYNLNLYSKHSRSSGLDGFSLLAWIMDEADAFLSTTKKSNAEEIHNILRTSATTRMGQRWTGVVISYPRLKKGFLMKLYEQVQSDPTYYVDKAPTWEVRSDFDRNSSVVKSDYARDPKAANALYACEPMDAEDVFFEHPHKIDQAVQHDRTSIIDLSFNVVKRPLKNGSVDEAIGAIVHSIRREPGCTYFLGGDAGKSGDRFALSVWHLEQSKNAPEWYCPRCGSSYPQLLKHARYSQVTDPGTVGHIDRPPSCGMCRCTPMQYAPHLGIRYWFMRQSARMQKIKVPGGEQELVLPNVYEDALIAFTPVQATSYGETDKIVDFPSVQEVCQRLITELDISLAGFDPWSTTQMAQTLMAATGCEVREVLFGNSHQMKRARLVKTLLYSDLLALLPNPERDTEWRELQRLGEKINHPEPDGSKDLYDAEAIAIWLAVTSITGEVDLRLDTQTRNGGV